jgi:hypothetical protein
LALAAPLVTVDLPLSLVADTVTLPITLSIVLMRQSQPEPSQASRLIKPAPPFPNGNESAFAAPVANSNFVPCSSLSGIAQQ